MKSKGAIIHTFSSRESAVHLIGHVILSRLHLTEDEGLSECQGSFTASWEIGHLRVRVRVGVVVIACARLCSCDCVCTFV
jgi:hypothetical protein